MIKSYLLGVNYNNLREMNLAISYNFSPFNFKNGLELSGGLGAGLNSLHRVPLIENIVFRDVKVHQIKSSLLI